MSGGGWSWVGLLRSGEVENKGSAPYIRVTYSNQSMELIETLNLHRRGL